MGTGSGLAATLSSPLTPWVLDTLMCVPGMSQANWTGHQNHGRHVDTVSAEQRVITKELAPWS